MLWVIVALAAIAASAQQVARLSLDRSRNRLAIARASWARDACLEIALGRHAGQWPITELDTTALGEGLWCRATVVDPSARINLRTASPQMLHALLGDEALADAALDWRDADTLPRPAGAEASWYRAAGLAPPRDGPFADPRELGRVRGIDARRLAALLPLVTVRGDGRINLVTAPAAVLAALPGVDPARVAAVVERRRAGGGPTDGSTLRMALLGPAATARGGAGAHPSYDALASLVTTTSPTLEWHVEGWATIPAWGHAAAVVVVSPVAERLAILTQEVE